MVEVQQAIGAERDQADPDVKALGDNRPLFFRNSILVRQNTLESLLQQFLESLHLRVTRL